jgi:hypothetical protein
MISIGKLNNGFKEMRLNKKEMVNYQNGTIYKISCKDESIIDCFVGSTTSHLKMKSRHKSNCNDENGKEYNYPLYRFIRDHGGLKNWEFILLEDYPCRNKKQLNIRERYWYEKLNATLNSQYPDRGKISEKRKKHYQKNKKEISEKGKVKIECPCGSVVSRSNLSKHKKTQKHQEWEETQVDKVL